MSSRFMVALAALLVTSLPVGAQVIKMNPGNYNPVQQAPAPDLPASGSAIAQSIQPPQPDFAHPIPARVTREGVFEVTSSDITIREALDRWARSNGWAFKPEHWTLDKDFPIQGAASSDVFGTDFRQAVRILLSSTELTDKAVQPCFYTNRVLRVIPLAASCATEAK